MAVPNTPTTPILWSIENGSKSVRTENRWVCPCNALTGRARAFTILVPRQTSRFFKCILVKHLTLVLPRG